MSVYGFDNISSEHGFMKKCLWLGLLIFWVWHRIALVWIFIVCKCDAEFEKKSWLQLLKAVQAFLQYKLDPVAYVWLFLDQRVVMSGQIQIGLNFCRFDWNFVFFLFFSNPIDGFNYLVDRSPVEFWLFQYLDKQFKNQMNAFDSSCMFKQDKQISFENLRAVRSLMFK